jgi:hypothetical protein
MSNKQLEKGFVKILNGLKNMQRDMENKQYQKHWVERKVPFTLFVGLSSFTKADLDDIRKKLDIKSASSLKKSDLIALLIEKIPENLENILSTWDIERYKILTTIANNGGYIDAPNIEGNQIEYFRDSGLIYTGTFEGKKIMAVPSELTNPIIAIQNNIEIKSKITRNTEWIKLTNGLLYYYGTLSLTKLLEMLEDYTKTKINIREYLTVIYEANSFRKEHYSNGEGYSNVRVFDSKKVKQEQEARKTIPFYPFTKQQLLIAGEPGFVDRNSSYMQLVDFLLQNFEIDKVKADSIVEECVSATRIGHSPNEVLNYLSQQFEFDRLETINGLMNKVVALMFNTREWFLKGYTSTELSALVKKHLKPLPTSQTNNLDSEKVVKISRNQPCPCGSGEKYKKCCGR